MSPSARSPSGSASFWASASSARGIARAASTRGLTGTRSTSGATARFYRRRTASVNASYRLRPLAAGEPMRLTPFAKGFVALIVLATVGFAGWHFYKKQQQEAPAGGDKPLAAVDGGAAKPEGAPVARKSGKTIVVGVNDFGGAYP